MSDKSEKSTPYPSSEASGHQLFVRDWTDAEEARVKRKLDFTLMPLLMLGFFALQLDRGNIGNALTDHFLADVGITQNQYNVGQQLLSAGIVVFEIPSNLILYRIGPQIWLSFQVLCFGLVSTFQSFQHGLGPFLATRLLLGFTESGYIPGALFTLTLFYTRRETAKRVVIFFYGNVGAAASTSLISYGVLQMRGVAGRAGWFWLFMLLGLFSIAVAIVLALFLPNSPDKTSPWLLPKLDVFTERERYIMKARTQLDDPQKAQPRVHITFAQFKKAMSNKNLYPHLFIMILNAISLNAFSSYVPIIINGFGFERLRSNGLASVGQWLSMPVAFAFCFVSDRFNKRGSTIIVALFITVCFMSMDLGLTVNTTTALQKRDTKFAAIALTQAFNFAAHPLNITWLALHTRNNVERAVSLALIIMCANAAGIVGAQIFRADDKPRYVGGWGCLVGFISCAFIVAIIQAINYRLIARKRNTTVAAEEEEDPNVITKVPTVTA